MALWCSCNINSQTPSCLADPLSKVESHFEFCKHLSRSGRSAAFACAHAYSSDAPPQFHSLPQECLSPHSTKAHHGAHRRVSCTSSCPRSMVNNPPNPHYLCAWLSPRLAVSS
eukprot:scaffold52699_cov24-Tisochrysis_lutea.AAC.2